LPDSNAPREYTVIARRHHALAILHDSGRIEMSETGNRTFVAASNGPRPRHFTHHRNAAFAIAQQQNARRIGPNRNNAANKSILVQHDPINFDARFRS
jgi:hypothetical protein